MSKTISQVCVIDAETTGFSDGTNGDPAEIIEISVKDLSNKELYHSYVMPVGEISQGAYDTHGLSKKDLANKGARYWSDVMPELRKAVGDKDIIAYNARFDKRMVDQTCQVHGTENPFENNSWFCASVAANEHLGPNPNSKSGHHRLVDAFYTLCPELRNVELNAHTASDDVFMTVAVVNKLIDNRVVFRPAFEGVDKQEHGPFGDLSKVHTVFWDMDGVLCDWELGLYNLTGHTVESLSMLEKKEQLEHVKKMACQHGRHYADLPPIESNKIFFETMMQEAPDIDFIILTSVGKVNIEHMIEQKKDWLNRHFPDVDFDKNFRYTIRSKDKAYFADRGTVLIDDFEMNRNLFAERGGVSVNGADVDEMKQFFCAFLEAQEVKQKVSVEHTPVKQAKEHKSEQKPENNQQLAMSGP